MIAFRAITLMSAPSCQTVSVDEAAARLGISRDTAYDMIRAGTFPVAPIRVGPKGKQYKIPAGHLNKLLGVDGPNT
jgi:excisionase family DNA binding protein